MPSTQSDTTLECWNATKSLARSIMRKHGVVIKTRGESSSRGEIRKGDPYEVKGQSERGYYCCDFNPAMADKIPVALEAARAAHGLDMKWDGVSAHAIQLFVPME